MVLNFRCKPIFNIMKNPKSAFLELFIKEMQLRNYSPRTVENYCESLVALEKKTKLPLDQLGVNHLKDYLHIRITEDKISVSSINQHISAFKILQVDVFKRDWEQIKIKRPRRTKKLPVVLSIGEVESLINATKNFGLILEII